MPDNYYLGDYLYTLLDLTMMKNKLQLCNGIWGSATMLAFGTLFVFMARYADKWDTVRRREKEAQSQVSDAMGHLDEILNMIGCYRFQGVKDLLGGHLVPILYKVSQIDMPSTIDSKQETEAVVRREWRNLPQRLASCLQVLKRDDSLSLAVFFVQLSRILYSVLNALKIPEVNKLQYAKITCGLIEGHFDSSTNTYHRGMLDEMVAVAIQNGHEASVVRVGDSFVPWLHITSEQSPGTAFEKGLQISRVHSIYLKMQGTLEREYRAKVDV